MVHGLSVMSPAQLSANVEAVEKLEKHGICEEK